jgi:hypothetical protein
VKHKSFVPWLVALVCFGPFAVALLIYYAAPSLLPQLPGTRELLEQPVPLPAQWRNADEAAGAWQLIYARMTPCEQQCAQQLGRLLQVQLALGRDQNRVRRVVWHVGSLPDLGRSALTRLSLDDAAGRDIVAALGAERMVDGRLYVADPRGEVILSYPADVEQKELLRDLKRLLAGSDS